jgi:hypothetical protein
MRIGHIDLSAHISSAEEQLVVLIEALSAHSIEQHALVRNPFLAKRLAVCGDVSVGPIVRSRVSAFCLMPAIDLLHVHDRKAVNSGVLLSLARSTPYLLTYRQFSLPGNNPLTRLMYRRAEAIICPSEEITLAMTDYAGDTPLDTIGDACNAGNEIDAANGRISAERMAAEYLRVYRRILDRRSVPDIFL